MQKALVYSRARPTAQLRRILIAREASRTDENTLVALCSCWGSNIVLRSAVVDAGSTVSRMAQAGPASKSDWRGTGNARPPASSGSAHPRAACSAALTRAPKTDSAARDSTPVTAKVLVGDGGATAHDSSQGMGGEADGHVGSAAPQDTPPKDVFDGGNGSTAAHEEMLARDAAVDDGTAVHDAAMDGGGDAFGRVRTETHDLSLGGGKNAVDDGGTADYSVPHG